MAGFESRLSWLLAQWSINELSRYPTTDLIYPPKLYILLLLCCRYDTLKAKYDAEHAHRQRVEEDFLVGQFFLQCRHFW